MIRRAVLLMALVLGSAPAWAADEDPLFRPLRYDEDWRDWCASRAAADTGADFKCLQPADDIDLTLGGDLRERIEITDDPRFGLQQERDSVFLHRVLVHGDLRAGDHVRGFVQLGFHESSGRRGSVPPTDVDRLDLQQGFVDLNTRLGGGTLTLRTGRQELSFGSARLISVRGGPNVRQSFDGVRLIWADDTSRLDAFYTRPVATRPGAFDDPTSDDVALWGSHLTRRIAGRVGIDAFYFGYRNDAARFADATGREERHSLGARVYGAAQRVDWNVEAVYQFGKIDGQPIRAWTIASDAGLSIDAPLQPRLGLKANIASGDARGDDGRVGTFNALFPRFPYFSEAVLFAPANFYDVHPSVTVKPARGIALSLEWNRLWRHQLADAVYLAPLVKVEETAGQPGRRIGDQLIFGSDWRINPRLSVETQFVHFRPGPAIRAIGGESGDFGMTAISWRF